MSLAKRALTFIVIMFTSFASASDADAIPSYSYCLPQKEIDFNPYRQIKDGRDLAFLWLLRSYISTEPEEPGIFEKFSFLPDNSLHAVLRANLKWPDGSPIEPIELAYNISKTLLFRPLGAKIYVNGVNEKTTINQFKKNPNLDLTIKRGFILKFVSNIENFGGTLREALSTNSRHNRFWPVKFSPAGNMQVIGKSSITILNAIPTLKLQKFKIEIKPRTVCKDVDFSIYPELRNSNVHYESVPSPTEQSVFMMINPALSLKHRKAIIEVVRQAFSVSQAEGIVQAQKFFMKGEPGFGGASKLEKLTSSAKNEVKFGKVIHFASENSQIAAIIEAEFKKLGVGYKISPWASDKSNDFDFIVHNSGIVDGRHVILQDLYRLYGKTYLSGASDLAKKLRLIEAKSAMTLLPDSTLLQEFEKISEKSKIVVPLARRRILAYTRIGVPIQLRFNSVGEVTFGKHETGNFK